MKNITKNFAASLVKIYISQLEVGYFSYILISVSIRHVNLSELVLEQSEVFCFNYTDSLLSPFWYISS